jgi:hypothetical protein
VKPHDDFTHAFYLRRIAQHRIQYRAPAAPSAKNVNHQVFHYAYIDVLSDAKFTDKNSG